MPARRDEAAAASERPEAVADPGKADRAAHGIPVVPVFDGYRAFAVVAIIIFHILGKSGFLVRLGDSLPAHALATGRV